MEQNMVLSLPQVTIDYTFRVAAHIEKICAHFVDEGFFPQHRDVLQNIAEFGLKQDHNIRLENAASLPGLGGALEYLRTHYPGMELAQIGGNGAIAALRGFLLAAGERDHSIPLSRYSGIFPISLDDFIKAQETTAPAFHKILTQVFDRRLCVEIKERPMTLALEGHHKVIIAYGHGRTLDHLDRSGRFSRYLKQLKPHLSGGDGRKILFSFPSTPFPLDLGAKLLDKIEHYFPSKRFSTLAAVLSVMGTLSM